MTGYDKLREAIYMANGGDSRGAYDALEAITAAGIPIEALANGEMVAVPKDPYHDLAISSR